MTRAAATPRPWAPVDVPALDGAGPPLRLHDTSTGEVRATAPGARALMYVCGITPYDATHLGHAATYLAFDLVNRVWRDLGHDVHYVQNVTDIDDPLLERAARDHGDWVVLGMRETALFREDMAGTTSVPWRRWGRSPSWSASCSRRVPRTASTIPSIRMSTSTRP